MRPIDQLPSTFDAPTKGNDHDRVLVTLFNARERVRDHWTDDSYYASDTGAVCALGAVFVADATDPDAIEGHFAEMPVEEYMESVLSVTARRAIAMLNEAALTLFPGLADETRTWHHPIETLNQGYQDEDDEATVGAQERVLAAYDLAITRAMMITGPFIKAGTAA